MLGLGLDLWRPAIFGSITPLTVGGIAAVLDLNFATNSAIINGAPASMASVVNCTRAGVATYTDASGLVSSVPANTLRTGTAGLLSEPSATNLVLQSQSLGTTWTQSVGTIGTDLAIAPDNTMTAEAWFATGVTASVNQPVTIAAASTNTISAYVLPGTVGFVRFRITAGADIKSAWYNVTTGVLGSVGAPGAEITAISASISNAANGYKRIVMTITTATVTSINVGIVPAAADAIDSANGNSIAIWGVQVEAGSRATSYIPTTTATVTRAADIVTMTGANFSSWYNPSNGTFVFDGFGGLVNTTQTLVASDGTVNNRISLTTSAGSVSQYLVLDTGINTGGVNLLTYGGRVAAKIAAAYALNDFRAYQNGAAGVPDTLGTVPTGLNKLNIGSSATGGGQFGDYINRLSYFNTALSNANLQAAST